MDQFIKKYEKPWNLFKRDNQQSDKKPDNDLGRKSKKPRILVIYEGPEGRESYRQRKQWGKVPCVGFIQTKPVEKKKREEYN